MTVSSSSSAGECIKVAVRIRPLSQKESAQSLNPIVEADESKRSISVLNGGQTQQFYFDGVFSSDTLQEQVYAFVHSSIEACLNGFNASIIAYGQTGTGKTYTMQGPDDILSNPERFSAEFAGIIPRAVQMVFDRLRRDFNDFTVTCSHLELYNEELIDLLGDGSTSLRILEDKKGVRVEGHEERHVRGPVEVFRLLQQGFALRKTAYTNLNERSSRSHCIFTMNIHTREVNSDGEDIVRLGKLNLVDLAGSENVGRSGAQGINLKEAGAINQSLLTLSRVIISLLKKGSTHVPYRESKLTRLLQESLGGKAKTVLIATVTPSSSSVDDTLNTLRYAKLAKQIENRPEVNQRRQKQLLNEKILEVENLKKQIVTESQKFLSEQAQKYNSQLSLLTSAVSSVFEQSTSNHFDNSQRLNSLEASVLNILEQIRIQKEEEAKKQLAIKEQFEKIQDLITESQSLNVPVSFQLPKPTK
ncbi:hypothetical protein RCL1_003444 [Eukaryota sp. TZLM3-RCL]